MGRSNNLKLFTFLSCIPIASSIASIACCISCSTPIVFYSYCIVACCLIDDLCYNYDEQNIGPSYKIQSSERGYSYTSNGSKRGIKL